MTTTRTRPDDGFMIQALRQAAKLAPAILPGELGTAAAEWLIGEANCHEGMRETGKHVQNLVNTLSVEATGRPAPTELHVFASTLGAAYDFAQAILRAASFPTTGMSTAVAYDDVNGPDECRRCGMVPAPTCTMCQGCPLESDGAR